MWKDLKLNKSDLFENCEDSRKTRIIREESFGDERCDDAVTKNQSYTKIDVNGSSSRFFEAFAINVALIVTWQFSIHSWNQVQ